MASEDDKFQVELKTLQQEHDVLHKAACTKDACKEIAAYVKQQEASDPLITHTADNKFLTPPNSGGVCCSVS